MTDNKYLYHSIVLIHGKEVAQVAQGAGNSYPYTCDFTEEGIALKNKFNDVFVPYTQISKSNLSLCGRMGRALLSICNLDLIFQTEDGKTLYIEMYPTTTITQVADELKKHGINMEDTMGLLAFARSCNHVEARFVQYLQGNLNSFVKKYGIQNPRIGYEFL